MGKRLIRVFVIGFVMTLAMSQYASGQSAGNGFTLVQAIEVGSATTGGINDLLTGVDLDGDGNGEIIVQIGQSVNAKAKIYEWNGTNSYDEVWSVDLPVNNASSDFVQQLLSVADTDNDGNLELFVASNTTTSADARVFCYEISSGALSTTNPSTTSKGPDGGGLYFKANTRIRAIVTGNADGNEYGELYVGNAGNTKSIEVWESSGNDSWTKIDLTATEENIGDGIMDMAPPADLDGDGKEDDLPICEQQGKLTVIDFSILIDPVEKNVDHANDKGSDTYGNVATFDLDNSGNPEIIVSNDIDDGILVFEWVAGSNSYNRDKTDAVLLSVGADIYSIGVQDYDADGKGEIYYTYADDIKYFEFNSIAGDFSSSVDFLTAADLITDIINTAFVIRPSMNSGNMLLDGDQYRDFVVGTDGNATGDRKEIFIIESQTIDSSLPVELTNFTATPGNAKVTLNWITESEVENLGFNIYRSLYSNEQFTIINDQLIPGHGNTSSRHEYQYVDKNVINGIEYWYQLEDVSYTGETEKHDIASTTPKGREELGMIPDDFQLFPCYPNPFNSMTNIKFGVSEDVRATLRVFDLRGNLVTTLFDKEYQAGIYEIKWNGRDTNNRIIGNGIYFYQLTTDKGFTSTEKMIFLR